MKIDGYSAIGSGDMFSGFQTNNNVGTNNYDPKESAVARKLGMSPQKFAALPEKEKIKKVHEYNETHPNDKIEDKGAQPQSPMGAEMNKFMNDIDWNKINLE
ncbi:hypothetical protein IJ182_05165 [bacterium]|nr:hypothetical protein [bacterium]